MVEDLSRLRYVAGDHHVHTLYSPDGLYRVIDHASHAAKYGLEWLVITDHGGPAHAKIGVELVHPDIVAARRELSGLLVFQGVEWNVPAAQHATVFVSPGPDEVAVLRGFERAYDGEVTDTMDGTWGGPHTARHEALALAGLRHLADRRRAGAVDDALMLVNHPALRGVNSPHQMRDWRDAEPDVVLGMEGAPGHQAAGLPDPARAARARGNYVFDPPADAFPGFPPESYRTYGGFDWMTATVGGLWDAMLAEGRPWWITANSDSHGIHDDTQVRGEAEADWSFWKQGRHPDPVPGGTVSVANGDFWPGYYSRTHVGVTRLGYREVMAGMRAGRIWVDHGGLLNGLDVRLRAEGGDGPEVTLGGTLQVRRGAEVSLVITARPARTNFHGDAPRLVRVDVIRGAVTGPAADRDGFTASTARVVASYEPGRADEDGEVRFVHRLGPVTDPCYLRIRGTDGNRTEPGRYGADVDPYGPAVDLRGNADPWTDLWFYANPIFVSPSSSLTPS